MRIITALEKHIPIIQSIARLTWYKTYSDILSDDQSEYMLDMMYSTVSLKNQIEDKGHIYLLCEDDGQYPGYVSYELNYENRGKTKIHKIYIHPEFQHRGVGRILIDKVIEETRKNNNSSVLLDVNKHNPAIGFYKTIGFVVIDSKCTDIGRNYVMDDYILERHL